MVGCYPVIVNTFNENLSTLGLGTFFIALFQVCESWILYEKEKKSIIIIYIDRSNFAFDIFLTLINQSINYQLSI